MLAHDANDLFRGLMTILRDAPIQQSRAGMVRSLPSPQLVTVLRPKDRVLLNRHRKANPYFHVMEAIWMLAGSNDATFLEPFNKGIMNFAEDNGIINGAYGHRWRSHFNCRDQLVSIVNELKRDRNTRQAVLVMYDPTIDLQPHWRDRPCNTHIYFRIVKNALDMTVCNRSNDAVWGLAGANIVHMTVLQEFIANVLKIDVGHYHVMTNNLHIYEQHWHLLDKGYGHDYYDVMSNHKDFVHVPIYDPSQHSPWEFLMECELFVRLQADATYKSNWINKVVLPMYDHYQCRLNGDKVTYNIDETQDTAWHTAEVEWQGWHE